MPRVLHRYPLYDVRPVDSDTLKAWCQVSATTRELWRVRLRNVEGGELGTPQGDRSMTWLVALLRTLPEDGFAFIGLETNLDQHGRHVGDILCPDGTYLSLQALRSGFYWTRKRDGTQTPPSTVSPS